MKQFLILIVFASSLLKVGIVHALDPQVIYNEGALKIYTQENKLLAEENGKVSVITQEFKEPYNHLLSVSPNQKFVIYSNSGNIAIEEIKYYDLSTQQSGLLDKLNEGDAYNGLKWSNNSETLAIELQSDSIGSLNNCIYHFSGDSFQKKYCLADLFKTSLDVPALVSSNFTNVSFTEENTLSFTFSASDSKVNYEVWKTTLEGKELERTAVIVDGKTLESYFKDLSLNDPPFSRVYDAKAQGWLDGYPDNTVRLNNKINRAEFAKLVIKAFKQQEITPAPGIVNIFPDASAQAWYGSTLYTALQLKLVTGYPDGMARPEKNINKLEALKVVLKMLGKDYSKKDIQYADTLPDQWYSGYTNFSLSHEPSLLPSDQNGNLNPTHEITRGEAIELISRILELK